MWLRRLAGVGLAAGFVSACGTVPGYAAIETVRADADSTTVVLEAIHGECDEVLPVRVDESNSEVRLTVPLAVERGGCTSAGLPLRVEVELARPLGSRSLVDARSGRVFLPAPVETNRR